MMGRTKISGLVLGVALLLILGALMLTLGPKNDLIGLAAEAMATATPVLTWENAFLDQIHFGESEVVLTDTLGLRVVGWISDAEVLIRRDTVPGGKESAIEVFNVETRKVRRLAEGEIWGKPIWSAQGRALAYLLYDAERKMMPLVWQTLDGQSVKMLDDAVQPIVLSPGGRGAMAYSRATGDLRGKVYTPLKREIKMEFARFAPPARNLGCGWKYDTAVSPDGKWQVVYNCEHFLLVNAETGVIKELDLGTEVIEGRAFSRWALDAQWSPDGQMLAVVATMDRLPNQIRFLLLLNPHTGGLKEVTVSGPFVTYRAQWSPTGRFLLLSGATSYTENGYALVGHRLIDISTGEERIITLSPSNVLAGASFAWSPDGKRVIFNCPSPEQAALCSLHVEVRR